MPRAILVLFPVLVLFPLSLLGAGAPGAPLELRDLEDREVRVAPERGRPVFLHFWATWCPPCVEELPLLSELASHCVESVRTLAVNVGEDPALLPPFAKQHRIALPILSDRRGNTWRRLDGRGLPTNLLWSETGASLEPGPHDETWWRRQFKASGCEISVE